MFESTTAALEHETVLRSASPCPILSEEVVNKNNSPLERAGISAQKDDAVKSALRDFRGSVKNRTDPRLPPLCDPVHFRIWVDRNVPLYIGKSNTRHEIAMKELSEWYIIFSALFPGDEIPTNPCKFAVLRSGTFHTAANLRISSRRIQAVSKQPTSRTYRDRAHGTG